MIEVTNQIELFCKLLSKSNPIINDMMINHSWDSDVSFLTDWQDCNWNYFLCREFLGENHTITPLNIQFYAPREYAVVAVTQDSSVDILTQQKIILNHGGRVYGFATSMKKGQIGFYPPYNLTLVINDITKQTHCFESLSIRFYLKLYSDYIDTLKKEK